MTLPTDRQEPDPQLDSAHNIGLNPFSDDVFLGGLAGVAEGGHNKVPGSLGSINGAAATLLESEISKLVETGAAGGLGTARIILLRSPRAGFGKSHLLANVGRGVAEVATVVPLEFDREAPARWATVLPQVVKAFERREGATLGGELTGLDFVARHVFATASRRLVHTGLVPCADPMKAEALLARDAMGLFDFADGSQPVATWFQNSFEKLLSPAGREIAHYAGIAPERIAYWMRALFSYAEGYADPSVRRTETLRWVLSNPADAPAGPVGGMELATVGRSSDREADAKAKALDFCRLATLWRPVVFFVDDLDSLHENPAAGRDVATLVSELQRGVPGSLSVISSNEDVWQSAFANGLSSALFDRITGSVLQLSGLTLESASELVCSRLDAAGIGSEAAENFLDTLQLEEYFDGQGENTVSVRAVLRFASGRWGNFSGQPGVGMPLPDSEVPGLVGKFLFPDQGGDEAPPANFPEFGEAVESGGANQANVFDPAPVIELELRGSIEKSIQDLSDAGGIGEAGSENRSSGGSTIPDHGKSPVPLGELKGMIDRFRSGRNRSDQDPEQESVIELGEASDPPSAFHPSLLQAPPPLPAQPADGTMGAGVPGRFAGARTRWAAMNGTLSTIDHGKLRHLISVAGNRFPVVRSEEIEIPDHAETPVLRWTFGNTEVYFGFRPAEDTGFWRALGAFVSPRTDRVRKHEDDDPWKVSKLKIVYFDTDSGSGRVPDIGTDRGVLDAVVFDRGAVASVYAAEEIVRDAEAGKIDADPGSVLGVLARELDFLWKRLTRPVQETSRNAG